MASFFGFGAPKCAHCRMELKGQSFEKDGKKFCSDNCKNSYGKSEHSHGKSGGNCCH